MKVVWFLYVFWVWRQNLVTTWVARNLVLDSLEPPTTTSFEFIWPLHDFAIVWQRQCIIKNLLLWSCPLRDNYTTLRLCVLVVLSISYWIPTQHKYCGQISCCCSHALITCSNRVYISCACNRDLGHSRDWFGWEMLMLTDIRSSLCFKSAFGETTLKLCAASQLHLNIPLYNAGTDVGLQTCRSTCDNLSSLKVFTLRVRGASIDAMI